LSLIDVYCLKQPPLNYSTKADVSLPLLFVMVPA
jgi:hypothetical protein